MGQISEYTLSWDKGAMMIFLWDDFIFMFISSLLFSSACTNFLFIFDSCMLMRSLFWMAKAACENLCALKKLSLWCH